MGRARDQEGDGSDEQVSDLVLATRLAPHWEARGQFSAGRETLEGLLAEAGAAPAEQAAAHGAVATLAMAQGDLAAARRAREAALAQYETIGDRRGAAASRRALAMVLLRSGDLGDARCCGEEALAAAVDIGEARGEAFALSGLGLIAAADDGDRGEAYTHLLRALHLFRSLGDRREAASVLANLGNVALDAGDLNRASRFEDGARQLFDSIGDRRGMALCLNNLAMIAHERGDAEQAMELAAEALDAFVVSGDRHGEAAMLHNLAALWEEAGASDDARTCWSHAAALFEQLGDHGRAAAARQRLAELRAPTTELSQRELEVAGLVAAGCSNREIAEQLFISQRTVESHLSHVFVKLGVRSRTQLARWVNERTAELA